MNSPRLSENLRALISGIVPVEDRKIVEALITIESSGDPWAWNPEPKYRWLWDIKAGRPFRQLSIAEIGSGVPPSDFPCLIGDRDQEWWGQRASWGLMQIMGAVARETGFTGPYLTELLDPYENISMGYAFLRVLRNRYAHYGTPGILSAYNSGSPVSYAGKLYADKILGLVETWV